jgi:aryl-alcohol dehydrogenase-like predicted oxidoreductase
MKTRAIPRTGEHVPIIGLGSWRTFDVGAPAAERAPLREVVRRFLAAGGRVFDSSPMYGASEQVIGDLLAEIGDVDPPPFLATKVWTRGARQGIAEMERSMRRFGRRRIDLMQVHNLLDWEAHLPVLREWKNEGRIRYLGVTHYAHRAFGDLERLVRTEALDFVQLPYNVADREGVARLLPAARDTGTAVLVMQPLGEGSLFRRVRSEPVPGWAKDAGFASWAELFLAFVLAHPAVTCAIPATSSPEHVAENVAAGIAPVLDEDGRRRLIERCGS